MRIIDLKEIFKLQKELDDHIHDVHNLTYAETKNKLKLSLAVELAELANEVRCFKFWSLKKKSEKPIILEEYVDGIHFISALSIFFNCENTIEIEFPTEALNNEELTIAFLKLFDKINNLNNATEVSNWYKEYVILGFSLGFSFDEVKEAYVSKNKVNHQRQQNKY